MKQGEIFDSRQEISDKFGGDIQKGIAKSARKPLILLFANEKALYTDYSYPKGKYDYYIYTGIGQEGNQDNILDNGDMYYLNIAVMEHQAKNNQLLLFEKNENNKYVFIGEYDLVETFQSMQPDKNDKLRRVFNFHLKLIENEYREENI